MKKGEIYQGIVERMDFPNKGIVIVDGVNVTVKNALPGQTVSFRITKKRSGQAEGKLLEVVEKAPCEKEYLRRIEEGKEENAAAGCSGQGGICRYAGVCGGCLYQGFPYEEQLKIKEGQVMKLLGAYLSRLKPSNGDAALNETACNGETTEVLYDGIMPSPKQYGYRNKMEFTFGDETKDGLLSLGLHKRGSFYDILTVSDCLIMDEDYRKILMFTRDYFAERNIPYFHRMNHTGYLRHLLVRKAARTGEILVALVTSTQMKVDLESWVNGILEMFGQCRDDQKDIQKGNLRGMEDGFKGKIKGILHIENDSLADAVKCDRQNILYGTDVILEELLGLQFSISAFSFFQTNSLGAEVLYELVRKYVQGKEAGSVVYDLYSGTGTIAQMLAPAAKKVIGVEIVEDAVEAAKKNAAFNGLNNCEFLAGDVLKVLDEITEKPDYIILDPPRDGIHPKALQKIIGYGVENMVYISCKPTSLARDLGPLTEAGYKIRRLGMVDMFPGTGNVECVCQLVRKNVDDRMEGNEEERKINYREEEIPDCGCIYG
ncbi:MAG: 23S rRNA (uracil(1939)-C(5))-methyltransferase RlmD [Lachnospiraceae bacterium]|nr:23S rRNA (uracil(1939)-C(5))-methyltransferase RlmD [Lachnospiraceae bacterium]